MKEKKGYLSILGSIFFSIFIFSRTAFAESIGQETITPLAESLYQYHRGQDIFFMLIMVAFLMMFIKRYEWGVALATMLVFGVSFPVYMAILEFGFGEAWTMVNVIRAVVMAITLVIAIGTCLGHVKSWHYIPIGILFVPAYMLIEWLLGNYFHGAIDAGGSMLVHGFAAYWGLGLILALRNKEVLEAPMETTVHSVTFVWLASLLLWILWPSFTTALLPPEQVIPCMITTYMALIGSTLSTYLLLMLISGKVDHLIFAYAILAGGVSIGSTLDIVGPWAAFLIGIAAGIISTLSFLYLQDFLTKKLKVLDTMGVHNLHGVCGVFGALIGFFYAGYIQIMYILSVIVIGIIGGFLAGLVIKVLGKPRINLDDAECFPVDLDRTEPF